MNPYSMQMLQMLGQLPVTHTAGGFSNNSVEPLPITPKVKMSFERRLKNALDYGGDSDLQKVVRDAAKYGVDWSHLLAK